MIKLYQAYIPITMYNSRPKLLFLILLVAEKKRKTIYLTTVIYDMYSKCIQKVFMNTGL